MTNDGQDFGKAAVRGDAPVATVLTPIERLRVDAAGEGMYQTVHRESVDDVIRELRARPVSAVLVSVGCCDARTADRMARMVREFPRVPAVALISELQPQHVQAVLALGRSGVREVVDVRGPAGWRELRHVLLTERGDEIQREALAMLAVDLAGAAPDCLRFFEMIFFPERCPSVRALARRMHVLASTLMSRFLRAGLPSPKRYLAMARLVRAARLFENPGLSIASVANHLDYSSPQSFGRHVRLQLQMTAGAFRQRYDGAGMLQRFRDELVLPYAGTLRSFQPVSAEPVWGSPPPATPLPARAPVAGAAPPPSARPQRRAAERLPSYR